MEGSIKKTFAIDFEDSFRTNCLILLGEAYSSLKACNLVTVDWDEENISANIVRNIDESEKAINCNITVSDECRIYTDEILRHKKSGKSASRIDIKLATNWIEASPSRRVEFYVEAKNLIEKDCLKSGSKTQLRAKRVCLRYISTGIDHFISGKYPQNGCLLGYVLEGNISNIVGQINKLLASASRASEQLCRFTTNIPSLDWSYTSKNSKNNELNHYFLNFVSRKES